MHTLIITPTLIDISSIVDGGSTKYAAVTLDGKAAIAFQQFARNPANFQDLLHPHH